MKYWIFILFVFIACQKDEVAIPTYFQINEIEFNDNINGETSTSKISDVWFYVNDQKQGIYEMPCTFPVIGDGTNNIKIFSGWSSSRISGFSPSHAKLCTQTRLRVGGRGRAVRGVPAC